MKDILLPYVGCTHATASGLLPYKRYNFTVAAYTAAGSSNFSEPFVCVTEEAGKLILNRIK